jgi:hypothetical protein
VKAAALHPDLSGVGAHLTVKKAEQGGFAGAARARDLDELTRADRERDVFEDGIGAE